MESLEPVDPSEKSVEERAEKIEALSAEIIEKFGVIGIEWESLKADDAKYFDEAQSIVRSRLVEDKFGDSEEKEEFLEVIRRKRESVQHTDSDEVTSRISPKTFDENINFFLKRVVESEDYQEIVGLAGELEKRVLGVIGDVEWNRSEVGKVRQSISTRSYESFAHDRQGTTERLEDIGDTAKRLEKVQVGRIQDAVFIIKADIQELVKTRLQDINKPPKEEIETIV